MKHGQQHEGKKASIRVGIRQQLHSEILKAEVLMNGSRTKMRKDREGTAWQSSMSINGPLDFSLLATGSGSLLLQLNSGRVSILKKAVPFENGKASFSIKGIPLLT